MLPTFYVRDKWNKAIKKQSDTDAMYDTGLQVGFEIESNTFATIETENCMPCYIRLRHVKSGKIFRLPENNIKSFVENIHVRWKWEIVEQARGSIHKSSFIHGPSTTSTWSAGLPDSDEVYYFSCPSWPSIAQSWIDRERRSQWPPKEIVREIVSKGCRIVHKSHPSTKIRRQNFDSRFQWGNLFCLMRCLWTKRNVSLHSKLS